MECVADGFIENLKTTPTDLDVRFARGDAEAISRVIVLYAPCVSALAYRLMGYNGDLDDVVQDVFVAALEGRARFRAESSLWTWLTAITLNRCRWHARKQKIRRLAMRWLSPPGETNSAETNANQNDTAIAVRTAVADLGLREREVIVLHYFEQMQIAEIAKLLGKKENAIAVQLHRARQKLKELLPDEWIER
jgi:RNA polymerase sigma-70 factor (ECF subfamily)